MQPQEAEMKAFEWREIKTAPRDGSEFLATDNVVIKISRYADPWDRHPRYEKGGAWASPPTHWLPLPRLPKEFGGSTTDFVDKLDDEFINAIANGEVVPPASVVWLARKCQSARSKRQACRCMCDKEHHYGVTAVNLNEKAFVIALEAFWAASGGNEAGVHAALSAYLTQIDAGDLAGMECPSLEDVEGARDSLLKRQEP